MQPLKLVWFVSLHKYEFILLFDKTLHLKGELDESSIFYRCATVRLVL